MGFSKLLSQNNNGNTRNVAAEHSSNNANNNAGTGPKQPQPVLGSFADLWEIRQTSDILLEDAKATTECYTEEYSFYEQQQQQHPQDYDDQQHHVHSRRVVCHNPYSLSDPLVDVFMCHCEECMGMGSSSQSGASDETYGNMYTTTYVNDEQEEVNQQQQLEEDAPLAFISQFMPPPPPRVDTVDVLAACGTVDAVRVVDRMMSRWYNRVVQVQYYFISAGSECPAPEPASINKSEWCKKVNQWWYAHFEHMQKKTFAPRHHGYW